MSDLDSHYRPTPRRLLCSLCIFRTLRRVCGLLLLRPSSDFCTEPLFCDSSVGSFRYSCYLTARGYPPALTVVFGLNAASAVIARFWRRAYLRKSKSRKAQTLGALRQALNTFETPSRLSILSSSRVCHLS